MLLGVFLVHELNQARDFGCLNQCSPLLIRSYYVNPISASYIEEIVVGLVWLDDASAVLRETLYLCLKNQVSVILVNLFKLENRESGYRLARYCCHSFVKIALMQDIEVAGLAEQDQLDI